MAICKSACSHFYIANNRNHSYTIIVYTKMVILKRNDKQVRKNNMLEKEKLTFHPISMEDQDWITQKLQEDDLGACEYTFANNFIWSEVYEVEVGQVFDCGVIRYRENGNFEYSFPFGNGDKKKAIELLRGICSAHNHKLCLYPIVDEDRKELIEWFPGEFEIDIDRNDFDYVYTVEKLSTLRGKKLHGKRNHIARFMDDQDWSYESLDKSNMDECRRMAKLWTEQREDKWNDEMEQEMKVLEKSLDYFDELGLFGGVLRKKGEIVAFTIGERLNSDTMVVHFEKAFPELQGAYPMINQQFVLHEGQEFTYVNREEDTGDLGLRKAKLSYYPDILLKKYSAVESHVVFANETEEEQILRIWEECFGDSKDYIQMYLKKRFETENMMVIHEDGKIVSMASFLPVQVTINGKQESARYVYAVATLPMYRKRGYASEIIKHAAGKYQEPLILQPADDAMEAYYGNLGFISAFEPSPCWIYEGSAKWEKKSVTQMSEVNIDEWNIEAINAGEYKKIRDSHFTGEGYVEWDEAAIQYAMEENAFFGGEAVKLMNGEKEELLMYCIERNKLCIVETTMEEEELRKLLPEMMKNMGVSKAYASNAGGMVLLPQNHTWIEKKGYLNLTLG